MATSKAAGAKRPRGRPPKTKVDPKLEAAICRNLEIGMPLDLAAEAEGVGRTTVHDWMRTFPEFFARVTRARAVGARKLIQKSLAGGAGSSDARWHLERRYREDYGPPKADPTPGEVKIVIEGGLPRRQ